MQHEVYFPGQTRTPPDLAGKPIEAQVIAILQTIYDPEISVNIYDLGLIYRVACGRAGHVSIDMTLTSPACPVAESLPGQVEAAIITALPGIQASVAVVWDPPWGKERISEAGQLALGLL